MAKKTTPKTTPKAAAHEIVISRAGILATLTFDTKAKRDAAYASLRSVLGGLAPKVQLRSN